MNSLISPDYKLLLISYDYMGIMLDLYGDRDEDGSVEVCDVTLTGNKCSLGALIPSNTMLWQMSSRVERADELALAESKAQGRIDRAEHDRSMDQFDGRRAL